MRVCLWLMPTQVGINQPHQVAAPALGTAVPRASRETNESPPSLLSACKQTQSLSDKGLSLVFYLFKQGASKYDLPTPKSPTLSVQFDTCEQLCKQ